MAEDVGASQECEEFAFAIQMLAGDSQAGEVSSGFTKPSQRLESRPNPDQAQIQQVTADLQSRNEQLESAQGQLAAFQAVFDENCRPHP